MRSLLLSRRHGAALCLALLLAACASSGEVQRQPEAVDEGLQATGLLDGSRVAISRGEPVVLYGDCDPNEGLDQDLCILVRTLDGVPINLVIENPSALQAGEELPVRDDACVDCDEVRTHAVVDLRVAGDTLRASGGRLVVSEAARRFAAEFDLRLGSGQRLTGSFNVLPGANPPISPQPVPAPSRPQPQPATPAPRPTP